MAGRGGKGGARGAKANLSFHVSELGFAPGEQLPSGTIQPPSTYPPLLNRRATPLSATEVDEYLLALSQEFRGSIRDSPFYLKPKVVHKDIVRYTDRYKQKSTDKNDEWHPSWEFVPPELKPSSNKRKKIVSSKKGNVKVNVKAGSKRKHPEESKSAETTAVGDAEIEQTFKKLSDKEKEAVDGQKNADDEEEIEEFEEEEFEDENDYNFDYYNDGGDKYGDDDDGEEGPVY